MIEIRDEMENRRNIIGIRLIRLLIRPIKPIELTEETSHVIIDIIEP